MWYPWLPVAFRRHQDNPFLVLVVVSNLFYFIWIKLVNFFKPVDSDPPPYPGITASMFRIPLGAPLSILFDRISMSLEHPSFCDSPSQQQPSKLSAWNWLHPQLQPCASVNMRWKPDHRLLSMLICFCWPHPWNQQHSACFVCLCRCSVEKRELN